MKEMKVFLVVCVLFVLSACQEPTSPQQVTNSTDTTDPTTDQPQTPAVEPVVDRSLVTIQMSGNAGCLAGSNADSEIDYSIGDKLVRNMHWKCASRSAQPNGHYYQIDALAFYDYNKQCFISNKDDLGDPTFDWGYDACDQTDLNPDVPQMHARFGEVKVTIDYTTFRPTYIIETEIINDGTMPFIAGAIIENRGTYQKTYSLFSISPGKSLTIKVTNWVRISNTVPRLILKDIMGNELDWWYEPAQL